MCIKEKGISYADFKHVTKLSLHLFVNGLAKGNGRFPHKKNMNTDAYGLLLIVCFFFYCYLSYIKANKYSNVFTQYC